MADIVLLSYISTNEYCYIDTSNLDGEKTLKPKVSILEKDLVVDKFRG
jgi:magnesium-transporting ATPase (P-type)